MEISWLNLGRKLVHACRTLKELYEICRSMAGNETASIVTVELNHKFHDDIFKYLHFPIVTFLCQFMVKIKKIKQREEFYNASSFMIMIISAFAWNNAGGPFKKLLHKWGLMKLIRNNREKVHCLLLSSCIISVIF